MVEDNTSRNLNISDLQNIVDYLDDRGLSMMNYEDSLYLLLDTLRTDQISGDINHLRLMMIAWDKFKTPSLNAIQYDPTDMIECLDDDGISQNSSISSRYSTRFVDNLVRSNNDKYQTRSNDKTITNYDHPLNERFGMSSQFNLRMMNVTAELMICPEMTNDQMLFLMSAFDEVIESLILYFIIEHNHPQVIFAFNKIIFMLSGYYPISDQLRNNLQDLLEESIRKNNLYTTVQIRRIIRYLNPVSSGNGDTVYTSQTGVRIVRDVSRNISSMISRISSSIFSMSNFVYSGDIDVQSGNVQNVEDKIRRLSIFIILQMYIDSISSSRSEIRPEYRSSNLVDIEDDIIRDDVLTYSDINKDIDDGKKIINVLDIDYSMFVQILDSRQNPSGYEIGENNTQDFRTLNKYEMTNDDEYIRSLRYCQRCSRIIENLHRIPVESGGWRGRYCSYNCLMREDLSVLEKILANMFFREYHRNTMIRLSELSTNLKTEMKDVDISERLMQSG